MSETPSNFKLVIICYHSCEPLLREVHNAGADWLELDGPLQRLSRRIH